MGGKTDDAAARAGGARTDVDPGDEPARSERVPHTIAAERREPQRLRSGEYEPGQEGDPKLTDSIDEGLARALPLDDTLEAGEDQPLADKAVEEAAFPLTDPSPNRLPDNEVGDIDDELERERRDVDEDGAVARRRST